MQRSKLIEILVWISRIISALLILTNPLYGFLIYLFLDYWDAHFLINVVYKSWKYYQKLDKNLDILGYLAMVYWLIRFGFFEVTAVLFAFRLIGQCLFSKFYNQRFLVLFPNLVEVVFIVFVLFHASNSKIYLLSFFIVAKLLQELFLHVYWPGYLKKNGYPVFIKALGIKNEINWG